MCFLGFPASASEGKEKARWLAPRACFPGPVRRRHGLLGGDTITDSLNGGSVLRNSFHDKEALLMNLFRPSLLLPSFWISPTPTPSFPFLPPFLSRPCTRTRTRTCTRAVSHVRASTHALTHTVTGSASRGFRASDRGGKTARVRRRPPSPPHSTPPHVNLRALWSASESRDLRAGQRQRNALPLPPLLSL